MIEYRIDIADARSHRFAVTVKVKPTAAVQRISLPVWIPGSYLVREFARHLSPITATQGQRACTVEMVDKATWDISCEGKGALTIRYEVYAFDTSVRTAFLDEQRGFFNGTSVFVKVHGQESSPHQVRIGSLPKTWKVATALMATQTQANGAGLYEAPDYDELVDHPVEMGDFWRGEFSVRGVKHEFVVAGASADFDGERLLADTRKIVEAQIAFWHGKRKCAFNHYVFMLNAVDDGYGGLEHRRSTALICSRKDLPRVGRPKSTSSDAYVTLLGLISHEYFHTWNVKRLKPASFAPYDYTQENYTRLLWFFEGFTSYYDDQFLLRTGLIDANTYVKLLGKTINQVWSTPGRHTYSVAQASFDAWVRYYRPDENTANATVSYYTKGSLVALALDLTLRHLPQVGERQPTLDGVMLRLWHLGRAITHDDIAQALADEAHQLPPDWLKVRAATVAEAWAALLHRWTETCEDLPLETLLTATGIQWLSKPAPLPQQLGLRLSEANGQLKVQAVMRHSLAEQAGLSAGDEWISIDQWRVKRTDDLLQWHTPSQAQSIQIARDQRLLTLTLPATEPSTGGKRGQRIATPTPGASVALIGIAIHNQAAEPERTRRKAWLQA